MGCACLARILDNARQGGPEGETRERRVIEPGTIRADMLPETPASMNPRISRHPHGIVAVDTEYLYPGHAAAHIIQQNGRAAFVDVGTNHSVPYLLAALEELGIRRTAVDYVFLTHVHLDHAGGAGVLLQSLPNAVAV